MTLREFLENPVGKGDTSIPNKTLILSALSQKYTNLINTSGKRNTKIQMKTFSDTFRDVYWVWLVIPSETGRGNTYDVVFRFTDTKKLFRKATTLNNYDIQVFANSPSFAFTYAYVYGKKHLLIQELANKLGDKILNNPPAIRNRNQNIMYDKYIYFGARYLTENHRMTRAALEAVAIPFEQKYLQSHIRPLQKIMDEYKEAEEEKRRRKRYIKGKIAKPKSQSSVKPIDKVSKDKPIVQKTAAKKALNKTAHNIKKKK